MARVAIVTGATGGIGIKFVERICLMEDIDEVWAVGRNKDKLNKLCENSAKIIPVETDLASGGVDVIAERIESDKPDIRILINNAGIGYMGPYEDMGRVKAAACCTLNCTVPSELISVVLPYMKEGARILNISSASSFQPNPYLAVYSASKVYLKNLSRALSAELKPRGITVTCVCPGWVDTGMLPKTKGGKEIKYKGLISPDLVVDKALRDSSRGKDMSVPGYFAKYFRVYSKITPTSLVMKLWIRAIKDYI